MCIEIILSNHCKEMFYRCWHTFRYQFQYNFVWQLWIIAFYLVWVIISRDVWNFIPNIPKQFVWNVKIHLRIIRFRKHTISKFCSLKWWLHLNAINTLLHPISREVLCKHCTLSCSCKCCRYGANLHAYTHNIGAIQTIFFSLSKTNCRRNIFVIHKQLCKTQCECVNAKLYLFHK